MSLIDEALKRAQEASQKEGSKGETARPWTPAPLPDAGLAKRRAVVRASLRALAGIGAVVVLAFLGRLVWNAAAPDVTAGAVVSCAVRSLHPPPAVATTRQASEAARLITGPS